MWPSLWYKSSFPFVPGIWKGAMPAEEEVLGRRDWRGAIGLWRVERRGLQGWPPLSFFPADKADYLSFWLSRGWREVLPHPASTWSSLFLLGLCPNCPHPVSSTACPGGFPAGPQGSRVLHLQVSQTCCPSPFPSLLCFPMSCLYIHAFYTWPHTLYLKMQTWEVACVYGLQFEVY